MYRVLFNRCWFGYTLNASTLTTDPQLSFLNLDYRLTSPSSALRVFFHSFHSAKCLIFKCSSLLVYKGSVVTGNEDVPHVPYGESQC